MLLKVAFKHHKPDLNFGRIISEVLQNNVLIKHNKLPPEVSPLLSVVTPSPYFESCKSPDLK